MEMYFLKRLEYELGNANEPLSFLLAVISIGVAFSPFNLFQIINRVPFNIYSFIIPFAAAVIAIIPHEVAHRQTARKYGCFSRFYLYPKGFLISLIVNLLLPIVVFLSGYTGFSCPLVRQDKSVKVNGITAAAGPGVNIALAILFFSASRFFSPFSPIGAFLTISGEINSYVGFFNLIPWGPLDGLKVLRWNVPVWGALVLISVILTSFIGGF